MYENVLERAKKLMHYDTMNITHRQIQNPPIHNAGGKLTVIAEILAIPYCGDTFMPSKTIKQTKKKPRSDIISTNVLGKKVYYHLYANE
jgi:hypothetical protein